MPERDVYMFRNLECENGHPWPEPVEILEREHTVAYRNEVHAVTTPHGALDDIRCPVPGCGAQPKDPNP